MARFYPLRSFILDLAGGGGGGGGMGVGTQQIHSYVIKTHS